MTNQEFIESIRLEGEEWRDVVGFEGRYVVSSFGRVASLFRPRTRSDGERHHSEQRIITGTKGGNRKVCYWHIDLSREDRTRLRTSIHREVAKAFLPNPNNYPVVDHIDCDGLNNHVSNLRWCTRSSNNMNPISRQRQSKSHKGIPNTKLSKPLVQLKDGRVVRVFPSLISCVNEGYNRTAISAVCNGRRRTHQEYEWMFLSDYEKLKQ